MIKLVEYLVSVLVPEGDYTVNTRENGDSTDIVINIAKEDIGKVIGKQGRIAKSIRTLVKAGAQGSSRYNVVIEEKNEL